MWVVGLVVKVFVLLLEVGASSFTKMTIFYYGQIKNKNYQFHMCITNKSTNLQLYNVT